MHKSYIILGRYSIYAIPNVRFQSVSSRCDGFDRDLEPRVRQIALVYLEPFGSNSTRRDPIEDGLRALARKRRVFERAAVASDLSPSVRMGFEPIRNRIEHAFGIVVDGGSATAEDDFRARSRCIVERLACRRSFVHDLRDISAECARP